LTGARPMSWFRRAARVWTASHSGLPMGVRADKLRSHPPLDRQKPAPGGRERRSVYERIVTFAVPQRDLLPGTIHSVDSRQDGSVSCRFKPPWLASARPVKAAVAREGAEIHRDAEFFGTVRRPDPATESVPLAPPRPAAEQTRRRFSRESWLDHGGKSQGATRF
jgi:hypothetical protein